MKTTGLKRSVLLTIVMPMQIKFMLGLAAYVAIVLTAAYWTGNEFDGRCGFCEIERLIERGL